MISGDLEGLLYTLTDSNARHNNDKFAPSIPLVQFEHGFDVDIGLTGSCLHFNIKRTSAKRRYQLIRLMNVAFRLQCTDILYQIRIGQLQGFIFEAGIVDKILQFQLCCILVYRNKAQLLRRCGQAAHITQI